MTSHPVEKLHFCAIGLIKKARGIFKKVKEPLKGNQGKQKVISIADCLSSALAIGEIAKLFDWIEDFNWSEDLSKNVDSQGEFSFIDDQDKTHKFRFVNQAPLNDTHNELKVNFLEYWEVSKEGKILYHNTGVSGIPIHSLHFVISHPFQPPQKAFKGGK